jgi:hypothetical protein
MEHISDGLANCVKLGLQGVLTKSYGPKLDAKRLARHVQFQLRRLFWDSKLDHGLYREWKKDLQPLEAERNSTKACARIHSLVNEEKAYSQGREEGGWRHGPEEGPEEGGWRHGPEEGLEEGGWRPDPEERQD